jgi:enoyl-CoA hydratase/carnithine racemase
VPLLYEKRNAIGVVTLSRPDARNAWGTDYNEGLLNVFSEMEDDPEIRCAVLTGDPSGGAFSAGANLKDPNTHTAENAAAFIRSIPKWRDKPFDVLTRFPKPLIGSVNGYAIGIGCIVTFCCDLIIASEQAQWRLPQVALGILPAYGGTARLARWVGKGLAMRLALGFPLSGEEAYRIGLAQWLSEHAALEEKTMEVAEHISRLPPLATRMTKESLKHGLDTPNIGDASLTDLYRFMVLELTEDKSEGHNAWRERREPEFKGE